MKSHLLIAIVVLLSFNSAQAQLPNGSIAPDFTLVDLNGVTHTLYDYLDDGKTVFLDFSAVWCGPCWGYHTSGALEDLYINHGPTGLPNVSATTTNDVMVIFIEGDGNPISCIEGTGCGTQGDWTAGTPYPIICTDGTVNTTAVASAYAIGYWPTVYQVCPDRLLSECGQTASPYSLVTSCLPPPAYDIDARSFMSTSAATGCSSMTPEITIQNYGFDNLSEVKIDVSLNGVFQYSSIFNQVWSNSTNSYQPLNLQTYEMADALLDPITGLSNNDVITIDVTMPNGVADADPTNNQTITFIVDLGFDNAYWDGPLSITVAGGQQNSWYLKQVSTNIQIASGYGGVTNVSNTLGDLTFNECYTLQSINGAGLAYTITDFVGNVILNGSASGVEDFDNFSTGAELWTGVEDVLENFNIYPNPANDVLTIDGNYTSAIIYDVFGKVVLTTDYQNTINVASLSNGVYFININTNNAITVKKITIAK
ncbi:MAG TPA: T9SS type A sorting domain-containing protein, partial [Flavobacteriales bacterium]|nr:T9SS type A sorting domain-containing protein [Flavobacteriales bacterium]